MVNPLRLHAPHSLIGVMITGQLAATPQTGEKRKRGRPRKNPEASTPKPADGPKRGRGRPRKVVSKADHAAAAAAAAASPAAKRGRGRPRKEPGRIHGIRTEWLRNIPS